MIETSSLCHFKGYKELLPNCSLSRFIVMTQLLIYIYQKYITCKTRFFYDKADSNDEFAVLIWEQFCTSAFSHHKNSFNNLSINGIFFIYQIAIYCSTVLWLSFESDSNNNDNKYNNSNYYVSFKIYSRFKQDLSHFYLHYWVFKGFFPLIW